MTAPLARTAEDLSTLDERAIVRYVLLELARRRLTPNAEVADLDRAKAHARALLQALDARPAIGRATVPSAAPSNVVDMAAWRARRAA